MKRGERVGSTKGATPRAHPGATSSEKRGADLAKMTKSKEGELVKSVISLLQAHGFVVFRRNVGAVRQTYTRRDGSEAKYFVRYSEPGASDIYGWQVLTGRHIEVEVKRLGQRPSPEQLIWLDQARDAGCIAFWTDSMEATLRGLKEAGPSPLMGSGGAKGGWTRKRAQTEA